MGSLISTEVKRRERNPKLLSLDTFSLIVCNSLNGGLISIRKAVVILSERLHRLVTLFAEDLHGGFHVYDN